MFSKNMKYLRKKTPSEIKIRIRKYAFTAFLSLVIAVVTVGSNIQSAQTAQTYKLYHTPVGQMPEYIAFQNSVPLANPGAVIINPLGYFVSIYKGKNDSSAQLLGTVFENCGSTNGRAGYYNMDAQTHKDLGTQTQAWIDYSPNSDLIERIRNELGDDVAQFVSDMGTGKQQGFMKVDTLMCSAQLVGSGYQAQSGWSLHLDSIKTDIAYTQVKIKSSYYRTSQILADLATLNAAYTYSNALKANLSVLAINPSHEVYSKAGTAILSATNNNSDNTIHQQYGFSNLNSNSFGQIFSASTRNALSTEFYNLMVDFTNAPGPDPPVPPTIIPDPYSSGGNIRTSVAGFNNFGQSSTLYSGQLGYFQYRFTNESYRIQHQGKYPEMTEVSDGTTTKMVPVTETKIINGKSVQVQVYVNYIWDDAPNFTKYNTGISIQGAHAEFSSFDLSATKYPSPTAAINRLICSTGLIDVNRNPLSGTCNSVSATSNSFRINYNNYNKKNKAGQKAVAGRATMWNSATYADSLNTMQIVPSDVEAYDITLIDASTGADVEYPYIGETLIPIYHYRNNTSVPVLAIAHGDTHDAYLDGHTDNYSTFTMGTGETATKRGQAFKIYKTGNESTERFTLQCSTYLDNFDNDASWESDSSNNIYQKSFGTLNPLAGYFIEPNSNYREDTDVISSFMILNQTAYNITNSDQIKPILTVSYTQDGVAKSVTVRYMSLVCPNQDQNMLWFKWHVPKGLNGKVSFSLQLDPDSTFIDFEKWGDPRVTGIWTVDKEPTSQTPDTAYADQPASWYDSAVSKLNTGVSAFTGKVWPTKTWSIYKQRNNGTYYQQTYDLTVPSSFVSYIKPEGSPTAVFKNNKWYEKSGYGFTLTTAINIVEPGPGVAYEDYTNIQNAYALFPEFMYDNKWGTDSASYFNGARYGFKQPGDKWTESVNGGTFGTFTSLIRNGNAFNLPVNTSQLNYVHYTPTWFPDGPYNVKNYAYDVWTPAGMLSTYTDSNEIRIRGNMYSDYYEAGN